MLLCVCVVCVVISFILDVRLVGAPVGVTQEEGHTGFLHLPFAAYFPSSTVKSNFVYSRINRPLVGHFFFVKENLTSCDVTEIRTRVPTSEGFEVTN